MKTFIIVRTASVRLPKKCLLPFGECQTVLEHVIKRCKTFNFEPVICTTLHPSDDILEEIAEDEKVKIYRGVIDNVEARLIGCARKFKAAAFHALDCDDPFFCPEEIYRSTKTMLLRGLHKLGPTQSSTEYALGMMGTSYALGFEGEDILGESAHVYRKWRLTLDYQEDYWLLATLARHHGYNASRWIIDEQAGSPLTVINQFRMKEWKEKQCRETNSLNIAETN